MDTVELKPEQALAIFSMVFAPTEADREPMASDLQFLKRPAREQLAALRLIELSSERRSRRTAEYLKLTDEGWHWASEHLDAPLPALAHAANVLHAVLRKLQVHLRSSSESLSSIASTAVAASPSRAKAAERKAAPKPKKSRAAAQKAKSATPKAKPEAKRSSPARKRTQSASPKARASGAKAKLEAKKLTGAEKPKLSTRKSKATAKRNQPAVKAARAPVVAPQQAKQSSTNGAALGERIRRACLELAGGVSRRRVRLRELRAKLPDVSREQLDRELLGLQRAEKLVLYRIDDPTDVAVEDERAALQVAGVPHHVVYLEQ